MTIHKINPMVGRAIDWLSRYSHPVSFGDRVHFRRREWLLATRLDLYLIGWGCDRHPFPTAEALDRWLSIVINQGGNPSLPAPFVTAYNQQQSPVNASKPADRQPGPYYPLISPDNGDVVWAEMDELQFIAAGRYLDLRDSDSRTIAIPADLIKRVRGREDCGRYQAILLGGAELWIDRHTPNGLCWTPYTEDAIATLDALMGDRGQRILVAG